MAKNKVQTLRFQDISDDIKKVDVTELFPSLCLSVLYLM